VTTENSGKTEEKSALALELTEMGLSLFVCDGDVPLECIAHVALDDPDFSRKLSGFRPAAEASAGKGFETQIWLPDEQVMFRSLKLDEETTHDPRAAAIGALSASTPFQGDMLCFDLGDTNGAGYTPVAAIPKEKMDEAMAFAKKMRMNPSQITTSNVVAGFSTRPEFKAYSPAAITRAAPLRVAALAMMLAAPIFLLSGEIERTQGVPKDAGQALVASLERNSGSEVDALSSTILSTIDDAQATATVIELPIVDTPVDIQGAVPKLASLDVPEIYHRNTSTNDPVSQTTVSRLDGLPGASAVETSGIHLPQAVPPYEMSDRVSIINPTSVALETTPFAVQFDVSQPAMLTPDKSAVSIGNNLELRAFFEKLPIAIFEPGPDDAPSVDMLSVAYVQNVFDGNIEIHDLMAVDEVVSNTFASDENALAFIRVANLGEGVLVRRPVSRSAPRLVQPAFMPRPEKRPLPLLPEQAFDYNTMVPINPAIATEDPPPVVPEGSVELSPLLESPVGLVLRFDEATKKILAAVIIQKRANAISDATDNQGGALANLISPRARDAVPLAGSNGALAQIMAAQLNAFDPLEDLPKSVELVRETGTQMDTPLRVARLFLQPSLPKGIPRPERGNAIVRELVPYDTKLASQARARLQGVTSNPTLQRPPSRRESLAAFIAPQAPDAASDTEISVETKQVPQGDLPLQASAEEAAAETENQQAPELASGEILDNSPTEAPVTEAETQVDVAAAAISELLLPRPPVRPARTAEVAALIEQLEPSSAPTGPISKYAIDVLYAPVKRPSGLEAQAKQILEQRNSVSHQVAIKQQPVPPTPKERLRIPTGARVGSTATIKDGIVLGDISLIGIYGTSKTRRALVRLPQGRYVQISRGDRVSGWTVSAVGEDAVRIQKGSRNKVLRLPN